MKPDGHSLPEILRKEEIPIECLIKIYFFICNLFNDAVRNSEYIAVNVWSIVNNGLEAMLMKSVLDKV
jgi:uncharacterized protein (UPF0262 family)